MAEAQRDYYEVLGVGRTASAEQIKTAYRRLARQYHPDLNRNDPSAEVRFKQVQETYDVLSDTRKRQAYDQFGQAGVSSAAATEAAAAAAASGRRTGGFRYSTRTPGGATVDFGEVDLNDLFESFADFSRRGRATGRRGGPVDSTARPSAAGADIVHQATLSLEQAARGTTLDLRFDTVQRAFSETIRVKIPPGVSEGSKVRVRGRGQPSPTGAGRGDLIIVIHISEHPYFTRDGPDIILDLPISLREAVAGATVRVPTLDGPVQLRIPPGVTSGKKLRIRERGVAGPDGRRGDQLCRILIQLPAALTEEERKALQSVDAAHPGDPRAAAPWRV